MGTAWAAAWRLFALLNEPDKPGVSWWLALVIDRYSYGASNRWRRGAAAVRTQRAGLHRGGCRSHPRAAPARPPGDSPARFSRRRGRARPGHLCPRELRASATPAHADSDP